MGVGDLRMADAFKVFAIGAAVGLGAMFVFSHIKGVEFTPIRGSARASAYPSYFWDLRDPGASQANFDLRDYYENSIPREGMFSAPDPDFTQVNFSEAYGPCPYVAPRSL
jgi:hypothetical protein